MHVGSALGLVETTRARWVKVLKEVDALLDAAVDLFWERGGLELQAREPDRHDARRDCA